MGFDMGFGLNEWAVWSGNSGLLIIDMGVRWCLGNWDDWRCCRGRSYWGLGSDWGFCDWGWGRWNWGSYWSWWSDRNWSSHWVSNLSWHSNWCWHRSLHSCSHSRSWWCRLLRCWHSRFRRQCFSQILSRIFIIEWRIFYLRVFSLL